MAKKGVSFQCMKPSIMKSDELDELSLLLQARKEGSVSDFPPAKRLFPDRPTHIHSSYQPLYHSIPNHHPHKPRSPSEPANGQHF